MNPILQTALSAHLGATVKLWDSSCYSNSDSFSSINFVSIFQTSSNLVIPNATFEHLLKVVILPSNRCLTYSVNSNDTVGDLKSWIACEEDIPFQMIHLLRNGQVLSDWMSVSTGNWYCNTSVIYMMVLNPADVLYLDIAQLDPKFDCDFTDMLDNGCQYTRGGFEYNPPYGWYRVALRVQGKYENDAWLGPYIVGAPRLDSVPWEWPVAYHGTRRMSVENIVCEGFHPGPRARFGPGVYTCPSIDVVASLYAEPFLHNGEWYQIAFQNRVNPSLGHLNIVDKAYTGVEADYWVSPYQSVDWNVHDVRPYGILLRKCFY